MADVFLHLEVDTRGIKAKIIEPGYAQTTIKDECLVLNEDITLSEDQTDYFDAGMDQIDQQMDFSECTTAMIFVPTGSVSFRTLNLPFKSEKKIRQVLPFELETLLPFSDDECISDFHIIESQESGYSILSATISKSLVEQYFTTLSRFNIKPLVISPAGYSVGIAFAAAHPEFSDFIFTHISEVQVTLMIFRDAKPVAVRFLPGEDIQPFDIADAVRHTLTGLSRKNTSFDPFDIFISTDDPYMETGPVYAAIEDLLSYSSTGPIQNQKSQNLKNIDAEAFICSIPPDKPIKYQFNFCRGEYKTLSFIKTYLNHIIAGAALFILALVLMFASAGMDLGRLEHQVSALDQQALRIFRTAFPKKKQVRDPYMEMKANVKAALKKAGNTGASDALSKGSGTNVVNLIGELSQKIDTKTDMEISRFVYSGDRLVLSGSTDNFNNVDKIKGKLEASDLFKKVNISSAASDKKDNRVNFKFIIDL